MSDESIILPDMTVSIFYSGAVSLSCVLCYHYLISFEPVTLIIKFAQHMLQLLWGGLNIINPYENFGREMWSDVTPTDFIDTEADNAMTTDLFNRMNPHAVIS